MPIQLHNYHVKDPGQYGEGTQKLIQNFRFNYRNFNHLVELELDLANILIVTLYEADDNTKLYIGDTGENILLVFNRVLVNESNLENYASEWIAQNIKHIFEENIHYVPS